MVEVSNANRVVFPEVKRTKGDVVAYYERVARRALVHIIDRPLSIKRFPKGLEGPGFFQKNVPPHFPDSIGRFEVPRSREATKKHPRKPKAGAAAKARTVAQSKEEAANVTVYPLVRAPEHLAYLANQGAIELHVPTARVPDLFRPDRVVIDLDPPLGAVELVRRAARHTRALLAELGLETVPVATGSKGYHVIAAIRPSVASGTLAVTLQKVAALLAAAHPDELTTAFRIADRGKRVFVDWLRNMPNATVVAPYSLRARPRATVATPLTWEELDTRAPDAFSIDDVEELLERPDPLALRAAAPNDGETFVAKVDAAFANAGLELETFDRFRS